MTIQFVLLDETNGATTSSGEGLDPEKLAEAAQLLTVYLNRDVGAHWGVPGGATVRAGSSPTDILENEWPFHIQGTSDVPGAIAYHTVNGVGVPDLYDDITLSPTLFGPDGALTAWAHEIAETKVDPGTNLLASDGKGTLFALEACDADEVANYALTIGDVTGYVSNFLLPAFFTPNHQGPYDFMTLMGLHPAGQRGPNAPFETVPADGGDYQIAEPDPNAEQQVTAKHATMAKLGRVHVEGVLRRLAKKAHPASRAYRRGLRLDHAVAPHGVVRASAASTEPPRLYVPETPVPPGTPAIPPPPKDTGHGG